MAFVSTIVFFCWNFFGFLKKTLLPSLFVRSESYLHQKFVFPPKYFHSRCFGWFQDPQTAASHPCTGEGGREATRVARTTTIEPLRTHSLAISLSPPCRPLMQCCRPPAGPFGIVRRGRDRGSGKVGGSPVESQVTAGPGSRPKIWCRRSAVRPRQPARHNLRLWTSFPAIRATPSSTRRPSTRCRWSRRWCLRSCVWRRRPPRCHHDHSSSC